MSTSRTALPFRLALAVPAVLVPWLILATVFAAPVPAQEAPSGPRLRYVATAAQLGPVAYRDPLGVPSPDGRWLATTIGLHLRVEPLTGGPVRELGPGTNRIGVIVWSPDSRRLVTREADMDRTWADWFVYDLESGDRGRLWAHRARFDLDGAGQGVSRERLAELAFRADGRAAALFRIGRETRLVVLDEDGRALETRASGDFGQIAWRPDGEIACLVARDSIWNLSLECDRGGARTDLGDVRGPIAFSPDGGLAYIARPNDRGTLDLWSVPTGGGEPTRLTSFARDTYAPYALADGRVLFKLQEYVVSIARVAAGGGTPEPVTTFQSETPSWDPEGSRIAFTYGTWRRVVDDARYPDIDQHIGVVSVGDLPADAPDVVIRHSPSEDQGMHWSPDGRWIALHSHAEGTDDIWLQPADGSAPAHPITSGGSETGWPRFSPDGRSIVYTSDIHTAEESRLGVLYTVGIDPESGEVTAPQREVQLDGFDGRVSFAEFSPDGSRIVFESIEGPRARGIWSVPSAGGRATRIHSFENEQWFTGIGVSPDDRFVAYVAPAAAGYLQLYRAPMGGGEAVQLTHDPVSKTHPSWSPAGDAIAFTAFRYLAHFWLLEP